MCHKIAVPCIDVPFFNEVRSYFLEISDETLVTNDDFEIGSVHRVEDGRAVMTSRHKGETVHRLHIRFTTQNVLKDGVTLHALANLLAHFNPLRCVFLYDQSQERLQ
jgi:hypothetical protein